MSLWFKLLVGITELASALLLVLAPQTWWNTAAQELVHTDIFQGLSSG